VDDAGKAGPYCADIVLNQNAHANKTFYPSRDAHTRLLLGPRFAMLRREFTEWRGWNREIPAMARGVLVTMGGSDPDNVTQRVVEAILSAGDFETTIVAGGSNPHLDRLREFVSNSGGAVRLVENALSMPELIANADVAVAGAGTTSWEMCFLGLPALLIVLADNQQGVADELGKQGIMVQLGRSSDLARSTIANQLRSLAGSPVIRREMSGHGRALVDGRGADRVVSALYEKQSEFLASTD
jgi:UDP-2,4-diacetamido-2,4,6-trideoxy-beta-L-altropyranose hydrolase